MAWHREQRVNVYAELIAAVDNAQEVLTSTKIQDVSPGSPEDRYREVIDSIDAHAKSIKSSLTKAELFGSDDSVIQGSDLGILMLNLAMNSMKLHVDDMSVQEWKKWHTTTVKLFSKQRGELVNQLRTDLGIYD